MESNLTGNQNDKIKTRNDSGSDPIIKPNPSSGLPQDPVYGGQSNKASKIDETYEGFRPSSRVQGMPNADKAEGFGSKFQMPGPDMSEKHMNGNEEQAQGSSSNAKAGESAPITDLGDLPQEFVDIQTSIQAIQMLVQKLRENLASPEQEELEQLMIHGSKLLTTNWKQLTTAATGQVSGLKDELKENPYRGLLGALKIGMALSQLFSTRSKASLPVPDESYPSADGHAIH